MPSRLGFPGSLKRRECLALLAAGAAVAGDPPSPLVREWRQIAATIDGTVGAAALHFTSGFQASLNGSARFPMASVCKLPIAMNMLALVEGGKFYYDDMIDVLPEEVTTDVSPIGERWPRERSFRLDEMLQLMIAQSDNTAVETLYRVGGLPASMSGRLHQWQVEGIRIDRTERQCGRDAQASMRRFLADPRDTATPDATVDFLRRAFRGELLAPASTARLIRMMEATTTGPGRIKGLLPPGTIVAHKTGTGVTAGGLNASTNDVGVITLPQGRGQLAVAFFVRGSHRDQPTRESVIARLANAAYQACA
jgi:beta-lactamase class A